jgi:hypothetical protein
MITPNHNESEGAPRPPINLSEAVEDLSRRVIVLEGRNRDLQELCMANRREIIRASAGISALADILSFHLAKTETTFAKHMKEFERVARVYHDQRLRKIENTTPGLMPYLDDRTAAEMPNASDLP